MQTATKKTSEMNRLYLAISIVLLAFSCSSEKDDEYKNPPPKVPLTEYEVDHKISLKEIDEYPLAHGNSRTFTLEDDLLGNLGLIVHARNALTDGYWVYDLCCPVHWEDSDPLKHKLQVLNPEIPGLFRAYCKVKGQGSIFDLQDGVATTGYAKDKKISMVKYTVDVYPESKYPDYLPTEGLIFTNPRYKKE